jgi:outer membrane lipoprotein-sorting protein
MHLAVRLALPTLLPLALGGARASAPDHDAEKLLASMRTAYAAATSAELKIRTKSFREDKETVYDVSFRYAKPNRLRALFNFRGHLLTRIADGKKVYTVAEAGKPEVEELSPDSMGDGLPVNLEALSFFDWKRQLSTENGAFMEKSKFKVVPSESWNDKSWIVLEETAHGQGLFVRYFVDPKTYLIWRCDVRRLGSKEPVMETEVREMILNRKLDPKLFAAPSGG